MNKETYYAGILCTNCRKVFQCEIPKGTRISDYFEGKICERCGCFILNKKGVQNGEM